jgi:hypothetical protein
VLLEEADELYSSIIHVYIRLKSDSFAFSNNAADGDVLWQKIDDRTPLGGESNESDR